jgi:hypothetical protein
MKNATVREYSVKTQYNNENKTLAVHLLNIQDMLKSVSSHQYESETVLQYYILNTQK